jgi:hypothetical protein
MKIGILITMYDKWDEAALLVDIIRGWKGNYEIGLTCNHPDGKAFAETLDINYFISPKNIPFAENPNKEKLFYFDKNEKYQLRVRIHYALRDGLKYMTEHTDCDYIFHTHCDGWMLTEDGVIKLIEQLHHRGKKLACRGTGLEDIFRPWTSNCAFGQVDDHFFAFNRQWFNDKRVWDYEPGDMLMHRYSVHGTLMNIFAVRVGYSNMWYYKELKDCEDYKGDKCSDNEVKPCLYDPEYGFLHIHRGSLPNEWGKNLQSYFLLLYADIELASNVCHFIHKYFDNDIIDKIKFANIRLNKKLKWRLFSKKIRNKSRITYKQLLLNRFTLSTLIHNMKYIVFKSLSKIVYPCVDVHDKYTKLNKDLQLDVNWCEGWK